MHNCTVCIGVASLHSGWACAVSGFHLDQMNLHILHICVLFLQCGWSCASSSFLPDQMTSHILSKCGSSLHCGWACAFSEFQPDEMTCCIWHKCMAILCCGLICASWDLLLDWMTSYNLNIYKSFLHWGWVYVSPFCCGLVWIWKNWAGWSFMNKLNSEPHLTVLDWSKLLFGFATFTTFTVVALTTLTF